LPRHKNVTVRRIDNRGREAFVYVTHPLRDAECWDRHNSSAVLRPRARASLRAAAGKHVLSVGVGVVGSDPRVVTGPCVLGLCSPGRFAL
jgi:hypothetical protein